MWRTFIFTCLRAPGTGRGPSHGEKDLAAATKGVLTILFCFIARLQASRAKRPQSQQRWEAPGHVNAGVQASLADRTPYGSLLQRSNVAEGSFCTCLRGPGTGYTWK